MRHRARILAVARAMREGRMQIEFRLRETD
jgi:hypothetical protein